MRRFGHVERMEGDRLTRKVYELEMQGTRCRGRSGKGRMDGVKEVLPKMGLNTKEVKECVLDSREWRSVFQG